MRIAFLFPPNTPASTHSARMHICVCFPLNTRCSQEQHTHQPSAAAPDDDAALLAAVQRFASQHARRTADHGPRLFRMPDGTLSKQRPKPSPYTLVSLPHVRHI